MATVTIDAGKLGARIRADHVGAPKAVDRAIFSALQRGKAYIVGKTPVDRGILRNAWKVIRLSTGGAELVNDQPYAGILERGARPFRMSKEGLEALEGWVLRKLMSGDMHSKTTPLDNRKYKNQHGTWSARKRKKTKALQEEAKSIAYAIAKHFERVGMKGKRFVWKELPQLANLMEQEINRSLNKFFNRP